MWNSGVDALVARGFLLDGWGFWLGFGVLAGLVAIGAVDVAVALVRAATPCSGWFCGIVDLFMLLTGAAMAFLSSLALASFLSARLRVISGALQILTSTLGIVAMVLGFAAEGGPGTLVGWMMVYPFPGGSSGPAGALVIVLVSVTGWLLLAALFVLPWWRFQQAQQAASTPGTVTVEPSPRLAASVPSGEEPIVTELRERFRK